MVYIFLAKNGIAESGIRKKILNPDGFNYILIAVVLTQASCASTSRIHSIMPLFARIAHSW